MRSAFGIYLAAKPEIPRFGDIPRLISDIPDEPSATRLGDIPPSISDIPDKSGEGVKFWIQSAN